MKPTTNQIRDFINHPVFKWFLETTALRINELDTVRSIPDNDYITPIARRMAINIVEEIFSDIAQAGEIYKMQKGMAEKETNDLNNLKKLKENNIAERGDDRTPEDRDDF